MPGEPWGHEMDQMEEDTVLVGVWVRGLRDRRYRYGCVLLGVRDPSGQVV